MKRALLTLALVACGPRPGPVRLTEEWPAQPASDYDDVVFNWTRTAVLRGQYQEVLDLAATFKSPEWRAAHALRDAEHRNLNAQAREQRLAQAQADMAGPYEVELMVTTWDRRENDLDRGKRSVWTVRLLDDQGMEVEPLEIVKDKRPERIIRAEFPQMSGFAIAYVARFPRDKITTTANLRLHMSSPKGGVRLVWAGK
jgi:hypothetical protein